jgi:Rrf2 family protein
MKIDYGVRILVHLASLPMDSIVKGAQISQERHIPEKFLFQISNELADKDFIKSIRGPKGGYVLVKKPEDISIADVMDGLEKTMAPVACIDSPSLCQISGSCSQQDMWADVEDTLVTKLASISVKDLVDKEKSKFIDVDKITKN